MDRELAEAIVRCWLADGLTAAAIPGYWRPASRMRAFLAAKNVMASNALWDGHPNKAYALLLRHGLSDKRHKATEDSPALLRGIIKERQARQSYRISREVFQRAQRSAWNVCKR